MSDKPKFHVTATFNGIYSFYECLLFIVNGIRSLGYEVTYADNALRRDSINIVIGSFQNLSHLSSWTRLKQEADDIIIYNWEQAGADVPWINRRYFKQMMQTQVWDYNLVNIETFKQYGVYDIHHVPMSYVPEMSVVPQEVEQDIDVLFYGVTNPRRLAVIDALRAKGLNVATSVENGWMTGAARDTFIARAKIVLNMHFFEDVKIFEIARVSYLLANKKAVVSEMGLHTDIDDDIRAAIVGGVIGDLPQLCWDLVHDDARRHEIEQRGFELFSKRNAAAAIKPAIDGYLAQRAMNPPRLGNPPGHAVAVPKTLQIGSGPLWNFTYFNIDSDAMMAPDMLLDMSAPLPFGTAKPTWRFGDIALQRGYFEKIMAKLVFHRVENLQQTLTNCLDLLCDGGTVELTVPMDMSQQSWAEAETRRAFNEKSWESILSNWWRYGWENHRFHLASLGYGVANENGMRILNENGQNWEAALLQARAVDTLNITLVKRSLTDEERLQLPQVRFLD